MVSTKPLIAPKLLEVRLLQKDYLRSSVKAGEPGVAVGGQVAIALAVAQNTAGSVPSDGKRSENASLVRPDSYRAMCDDTHPILEEDDLVLLEVLDRGAHQVLLKLFLFNSVEERGVSEPA